MDDLSKDARSAKKAGMSYGKWKALQPVKQTLPRFAGKLCAWCRKPFTHKRKQSIYCCPECARAAARKKEEAYKLEQRERKRNEAPSLIDNQKFSELYDKGFSDRQIATACNVDPIVVQVWRENKFLTAIDGRAKKNVIDYTEIDCAIRSGASRDEIMERFHISKSTCNKRRRFIAMQEEGYAVG